MKKFFTLSILALFFSGGAQAQLLYKISGKGLSKESYIIGTYHLAPSSFARDIKGANEALQSVDAVCGELDMSDLSSGNATAALTEAMMLPDGQSITDIMTEEQIARLNAYMMEVMGMDLNNPMCSRLMGRMRPSAIAMNLEMMVYKKITPGFNPLKLIDSYFQDEAAKMGKRVLGLESVEDQIAALFANSAIEDEVASLMQVVDNPEAAHQAMKALADAYFSQDIKAIAKCVTAEIGGMTEDSEEWNRLCVRRNHNWVEQMPTIMSEQSTLFVVGAAHLIGDDGVITLLKKAGYKVKPVK